MKVIGSAFGDRIDGAAVQPDLAGIGAVHAGEDLDQRRLAGAVLAEQRVHLAGAHVEVDRVERERAGEALGQRLVTSRSAGSALVIGPSDCIAACDGTRRRRLGGGSRSAVRRSACDQLFTPQSSR